MRSGCNAGFAAAGLLALALPRLLRQPLDAGGPCLEEAAAEGLAAQHCGMAGWGAGRFPFATIYRHGALDQELLAYLQAAMVGWKSKGLAQRGAHGDSSIWKIDWHTITEFPQGAPVFIPRPDKPHDFAPRAPCRLFGFAEAFRDANAEVFEGVARDLHELAWKIDNEEWETQHQQKQWTESPKDTWLLRVFAELILARRHFGVIEAQIFHGEHTHEGGAHNDGTTSVLHLSLTLGGSRTVFSQSVGDGTEDNWRAAVMRPGDLYLSSPSFFLHRVSYHPAPIQAPMVALHFRFGFPPELAAHVNQRWDLPVLEIARVVARRLRQCEASLRTPSLAAVQAAEARCRAAGAE